MWSDIFRISQHPTRTAGIALSVLIVATAPVAMAQKPKAHSRDAASAGSTTTFTGRITTATGRFHGDHGTLTVELSDPPPTSASRPATLAVTSLRCREQRRCLELSGRLTGTLVRRSNVPDTPVRFAVNAAGKLTPIGHVRGTGIASGTGFIFVGRETLQLKLSASGGQLTIDAHSKPVPGFTTP